MHDRLTDDALLGQFARDGDEQAFAAIVQRHLNLVYGAALRQVGNDALAQDVTQAVFILLAQKASSLHGRTVLAGWLVNTARLCARTAVRREARHLARERKAAAMRSEILSSAPAETSGLGALLDQGLAALNASDRNAVVLRYLQDKPFKDVALSMGVSEEAAMKRVSRAIVRMRSYFARHGLELAPEAVGVAILREAAISAPAHVTPALVKAGVLSSVALTADSAASRIAAASRESVRWGVVAMAGLVGIIALAIVLLARAPGQPVAAATSAPKSAPATTRTGPIRVGFYLSHASAIANNPANNQPFGYGMLLLKELADPSFEIVPIIEPATEELGDLPKVLIQYFPKHKPLNAASIDDLRTLDVIVAGSVSVPPDVMNALEQAVNEGKGLMTRNLFALTEPDLTPQARRLYGVIDAAYAFDQTTMECEVVAEHPILASRKGKPGAPVHMRINGVFGVLTPNSQGLIRLKNLGPVRLWDPRQTRDPLVENGLPTRGGVAFYTVYTTVLGKGRIVHCCFATYDTPKNIADSIGPEFTRRSVKWLAEQ